MSRHTSFRVVGIVLLAVVVSAAGCNRVRVRNLPPAVTKAVEGRFPTGEIRSAERKTEDGLKLYELSVRQSDADLSVKLTGDGTLLEVEQSVDLDDAPKAVADAAGKATSASAIYRTERVEQLIDVKDGKLVPLLTPRILYEVKALKLLVWPYEVTLTPDGKVMEAE